MKHLKYLLLFFILVTSIFWVIKKNTNQIHTSSGDSFSFAIEADPHMDEQSSVDVYKQTLSNIVAAKPDFLIDLGDTFMLDKQPEKNTASFTARYQLMKKYFDAITPTIPLYLVSGNHDGEVGWETNQRSQRLQFFPSQYDKNYYSFIKNNALFIVLDPYTYTTTKPNKNGWDWTLGKTQYDWLKNTLNNSNYQYKFVFIHQLVGGDNQGRGGVEFAKLYEWGGNNLDGSYGFNTYRPNWGKPIHQLLVDNKVNAVFKGHDHFFAKQDLDGVVYQTLPQPSHPGDKINTATEYGYLSGKIIGGSGFLNITVSSNGVNVDFVGANQKTLYSYLL